MTIKRVDGKAVYIKADEGKVFRRRHTRDIYGDEIYLGYSYYINGEKLSQPHLDVPADFEEIFEPKEDGTDQTVD